MHVYHFSYRDYHFFELGVRLIKPSTKKYPGEFVYCFTINFYFFFEFFIVLEYFSLMLI